MINWLLPKLQSIPFYWSIPSQTVFKQSLPMCAHLCVNRGYWKFLQVVLDGLRVDRPSSWPLTQLQDQLNPNKHTVTARWLQDVCNVQQSHHNHNVNLTMSRAWIVTTHDDVLQLAYTIIYIIIILIYYILLLLYLLQRYVRSIPKRASF